MRLIAVLMPCRLGGYRRFEGIGVKLVAAVSLRLRLPSTGLHGVITEKPTVDRKW